MHYQFGTRQFMESSKLYKGILCLYSAAFYHSYGTLIPAGIQMLVDKNKKYQDTFFTSYYPTTDLDNNIIKFSTGNGVTNKPRTVLELMEYNPMDEYVSQTIEDYLDEFSLQTLIDTNKQYNYCTKSNFDLAMQCLEEYQTKVW